MFALTVATIIVISMTVAYVLNNKSALKEQFGV